MPGERIIIDRKYVHKFKEENVFLCNLRRALPQSIDKELFENKIKNSVSAEEFELFNKIYEPNTFVDSTTGENTPRGEYILPFLPAIQTLSAGVYDVLLAEKKYGWEKELLEKLYARETAGKGICYRLKEDISEPYDNFIISSFKAWDLFITTEDRTTISAILEKIPEAPRKEIYYANMFVNTGHPFFFEHPNEHVPGMMLIETIRQFIVACGHVYGKIPFEGTQLILNSLDCQFSNYANINYPILLRGTAVDYKFNREGYWQYVTLRAEVFQGGKCLALFNLKGTCISSRLFERIRKNQIIELNQSRFMPLDDEEYELFIHQETDGLKIPARLVNLSMEGMSVKIRKRELSSDNQLLHVSLSYGLNGNIEGRYKKIWHDEHGDDVIIGLKNLEMGENGLKNLYDLISTRCVVLEKTDN